MANPIHRLRRGMAVRVVPTKGKPVEGRLIQPDRPGTWLVNLGLNSVVDVRLIQPLKKKEGK
jgi:hypothetical protein